MHFVTFRSKQGNYYMHNRDLANDMTNIDCALFLMLYYFSHNAYGQHHELVTKISAYRASSRNVNNTKILVLILCFRAS